VPDTPPPEPPDERNWIEHSWDRNPERPPILGPVVLVTLVIVVGAILAIAIWLFVSGYLGG
jgi:hypothetical protein